MVWFGLKKALVSFRHDLGFSANAHRHQVSFGLSLISSRLVSGLCTLWALVHHHLSLGCEVRPLRHPALPLVHQLSLVRTFLYPYHMILYLYLLCRSHDEENRLEIQEFNYFFSSLIWGLGRHWGEISSSSWGKETLMLMMKLMLMLLLMPQSSRAQVIYRLFKGTFI